MSGIVESSERVEEQKRNLLGKGFGLEQGRKPGSLKPAAGGKKVADRPMTREEELEIPAFIRKKVNK